MRAVVVMFDTLNRLFLPPYGGADDLGNFSRLAARSVTFDRCYAGSMPCMPARREMHTGRYNFLHRSWGPLEPFDDSVPAMLGDAGVYTHLVTDHKHYWGDGGATYHGRFRSFEFFRGQEGDSWKGIVRDPEMPPGARGGSLWRQDQINRRYTSAEDSHPQTLTFDAGIEFIAANHEEDRWFVQIEAFDPHEPFTASKRFQRDRADGTEPADWPVYRRVVESDVDAGFVTTYRELLRQCDASLGRVLDAFDEFGLWDDTLLIVCTDHGLLLGEHEWWGKMVQPWYEENIHVPLFVRDPRTRREGFRCDELVQTIDIGPTLLDFFGLSPSPDMMGLPIGPMIADGSRGHDAALFGNHGGHVTVTDGRHVYMRASATIENQPLNEYTLMPTRLQGAFDAADLREADLVGALPFTKGIPVLRVPVAAIGSPWTFGTLLFDLLDDPGQESPLEDDIVEMRMIELLVAQMRAADAPQEQYERLGLPVAGAPGDEHLMIKRQKEQRMRGLLPAPRSAEFGPDAPVSTRTVRDLLEDPHSRDALLEVMPFLTSPFVATTAAPMTPVEAAALGAGVGTVDLRGLNDRLTRPRGGRPEIRGMNA
jgi:arylsulfatase A-like enzyme